MRGSISPLHHCFYDAVLILLQIFGYAAVVFGTSRVSPFVREPLKGFSRNLVVVFLNLVDTFQFWLTSDYNDGCCVKT